MFELKLSEFIELSKKACYYCGSPPSVDVTRYRCKGDRHFDSIVLTNGVDRVDSSIGYTVENCVTCCYTCNRAKSDMEFDDFIKWIRFLKENTQW